MKSRGAGPGRGRMGDEKREKSAARAGRGRALPDPKRCADLLVDALRSHRGLRAVEVDRTRATITLRFEDDRLSRRSAERLAGRPGRGGGRPPRGGKIRGGAPAR